MTLPILAYGNPLLREVCRPVDKTDVGLGELINNMWDTLRSADGSGLAAPQVGQSLRLFIVDSRDTYLYLDKPQRAKYFDGDSGIEETFINAEIVHYDEDHLWTDVEGCLSIPGLHEPVKRPWNITIRYLDGGLNEQVRTFHGLTARIIQHEYDHTQGKLYIDRLDKLRRNLIANRLKRILNGKVPTRYLMRRR